MTRTSLLCAAFYAFGIGSAVLLPTVVPAFHLRPSTGAQLSRTSVHARGKTVVPPYGQIQAVEVPMENTDGAFPDHEQRLAKPHWIFEDVSAERLSRLFRGCELSPSQERLLLDRRNWQFVSNGITVCPSGQLVWSLSPQSRARIYSVLAKSAANFPQSYPFRFPPDAFEKRFSGSGLRGSAIDKLRQLTYTNSGYLCFTDLQAMKSALSEKEFKNLTAILYQIPTYFVRVHLAADSDVDSLVKYWGKGGRERIIAPFLTSLTKAPGGRDLGVGYFMPPFARCRLYTYPYTWNDQVPAREDCFFTSMNFFNAIPNTNFLDRAYTSRVLRSDYALVQESPAYGDIVALSNDSGEIFHTCVYLAEDFVFTKNGADAEQPWVLMRLSDVLGLYLCPDRAGSISFFRRKDMT